MSREAIPQLPRTAENSISGFPPDLRYEAASRILGLSHVELHTEDAPIPAQDLQAEQHSPHIERVTHLMNRTSSLLEAAHEALGGSESEPTFDQLAQEAKSIALGRAKDAAQEHSSEDVVSSLEDMLVIEALSATDPNERQVRSLEIFQSIKGDEHLVDGLIVASHNTFGVVARHDNELVPLSGVAQANEAVLATIKTRDYNDNFSEIAPTSFKETQAQAFETIKELATPLIVRVEAEAKQTGAENTQLHARNIAQVKGALAITEGIATPHEGLDRLKSRDIFISHSFIASRKEALQMSLALDAMGMDPRIDNKGAGVVVMEHPDDPSYPDGPRFYTKWRNEFRDSIKVNGNGMLILTSEALDSPVVAWEVGVMLKKNCDLIVAYDDSQTEAGQQSAMDKLQDMLAEYESGNLATPDMLAREGGNLQEVLKAIRDAPKIKLRPEYFDDQDELGTYIVESMLETDVEFTAQSAQQQIEEAIQSEEAESLDTAELWQKLEDAFKTLEDAIDQSPGDAREKWRQHYKLDQAKVLLAGILQPDKLTKGLDKTNLFTPDKLIDDGSEASDFLRNLLQESQKLGFKIGADSPDNTLCLLLQTSDTMKNILAPGMIDDFAKYMKENEPVFPIFIGQGIFSDLNQEQAALHASAQQSKTEYAAKRQEWVNTLLDSQSLVFNDEVVQMQPATRAQYARLLARSLATKFALNELALRYNKIKT